ncbi:hypothetical protein IMSAGC020_01324 [Lachnospiraceae bacterium]|jgi:hypothetical protein|nr:hypothetical protein IMSAGC020_01324 [Lachnospiraceae bacterium]
MNYGALKGAEHIWIYGAGVYGHKLVDFLSSNIFQLPIRGVVVTHRGIVQKKFKDFDIHELKDVKTPNESTVFIIAASFRYQEEIITELEKKGYSNYVIWDWMDERHAWTLAEYKFEDRRKNCKKLCMVLSGYKDFLWDSVFGRLKKFVPEDIDICILSSGIYDERLSDLADVNGWSYLSTEFNDLTMIQNIAISLFEEARWIYKMDEDIFLTEGSFDKLYHMWCLAEENEPYHLGIMAPLIPVNGYGYIRILNYINKLKLYEQRFGKAFYGGISDSMIEKSVDAARFMWGEEGNVPELDNLNSMFSGHKSLSCCNVRFSIGFILFGRWLWDEIGGFEVTGCKDLGVDEIQLCRYCMIHSLAIGVAEDTVVGHFSFGQQTTGMRDFYEKNPELFEVK